MAVPRRYSTVPRQLARQLTRQLGRQLGRQLVRQVTRVVALTVLGGCSTRSYLLIHPAGPVADASLRAWIVDTGATFLVIGPATLLVLWAIWRYRRQARGAYQPGWSHSLPLEATFWGVPLIVVLALGFYATSSAFETDPSGPGVIANRSGNPDAAVAPVNIDVIATDWQWLFIYPDRHIAVANALVIPVHTPVRFRLTSATVATDFFIPELTGQIDVMPGMRTWQGLIADRTGSFQGFASDYNGPGFSWMRFQTRVVSAAEFASWENAAARAPGHLDDAGFDRFAAPTINEHDTTTEFSAVQEHLFEHVMQNVMMGRTYVTPSDMTEKASHDVNGGRQPTSRSANGNNR